MLLLAGKSNCVALTPIRATMPAPSPLQAASLISKTRARVTTTRVKVLEVLAGASAPVYAT